jgi:hypothetical protein
MFVRIQSLLKLTDPFLKLVFFKGFEEVDLFLCDNFEAELSLIIPEE